MQARRTGASAAAGVIMGWLSVVATGLVVRGSMRRKQRRADELAQARELDRLRALTEDSEGEYFIWPPEDDDER